MQSLDNIKEYTRTVCNQIRWKKAHAETSEELENHIADQRDTYIANGEEEAAATGHAIEEMGDPVAVGLQLDRTHRPRPQWDMLCIAAALLVIGLVIRLMAVANGDSRWTVLQQITCTVLGLGALAAAYFADFTLLGKYPKTVFFLIAAIPVAFLLLPDRVYGKAVFADYSSLLFPLGFAAFVYAMRNKKYLGILLCELAFVLLACIVLKIPAISPYLSPSSSLVYLRFILSGVAILCLANAKGWFIVKRRYGFLLILILAIIPFWYATRFFYWDIKVDGFMSYMYAGAKLFGWGYIPEQPMEEMTTQIPGGRDNMLYYVIIRFGWIAFILLMGVLIFFIVKGLRRYLKQKSSLGMMVSAAVLITFALQIVSVATTLFLLPIGRLHLPFLSYGNTLTVLNAALIGLMLSVFRTGDVVKDKNAVPWKGIINTHVGKTALFKRSVRT